MKNNNVPTITKQLRLLFLFLFSHGYFITNLYFYIFVGASTKNDFTDEAIDAFQAIADGFFSKW